MSDAQFKKKPPCYFVLTLSSRYGGGCDADIRPFRTYAGAERSVNKLHTAHPEDRHIIASYVREMHPNQTWWGRAHEDNKLDRT